MRYKLFNAKLTEIDKTKFLKDGDLFVCIDPDNKIAVPEPWLVALWSNRQVRQLGVFWRESTARLFCNRITRGDLFKVTGS